ncbi:sugar ABC transporter ATP-binding protein [Pseudonocardia ailaonensis]|uniref:sugar ABC transporter ATP-binding protein n=1 Tax=Pseudonocardia ailaonensis TaxID=367279 RepID=UPI0031DFA68E
MSKSYGKVGALKSVDFAVGAGESVALLGQNGAGKSTLVKILSGLVRPDAGVVSLDGDETALHSGARAQRAGIAVVQQEVATVATMTVAENLLLGLRAAPVFWTTRTLREHAKPLLAGVGLGHVHPDTPMEDLTIAEQQLVDIARALSEEAKVLVLDEPTASLSDTEIERVLGLVREIKASGRSIVYVTHRLDEVFTICDRAVVFRNGEVVASIEVATASVPDIVTAMLGEALETYFPEPGELGDTRLRVVEMVAPGLAEPVSVALRRGEILGLTGQLGSGASAFVAGLAGMSPATSAEVELDGRAVTIAGRRDGLRDGISYCSGDRKHDGLFPGVSVYKNLSAPWISRITSRGRISRAREYTLAADVAAVFSIDESRLTADADTLSGGNQQKVALGKWLGTDPRVLLVEEPTRGVDVGARAEIYAQLRRLCREGLSVIVASSDTAEVLGLCDTIGVFYKGRLVETRRARDWTESALLTRVMHDASEEASS